MVFINEIARDIWGGGDYTQKVSEDPKCKAWGVASDPSISEEMPISRFLNARIYDDEIIDFERSDGSRGTQLISSAPIKMPDGKFGGCVGIAQDITMRSRLQLEVERQAQQLKLNEQHYRRLLESLPLVISRYDRELRYIYRGSQLSSYFGIPQGEYVGKTWAELGVLEEEYRPWADKCNEVLLTGRMIEFESKCTNSKGEIREFLAQIHPETNEAGEIESLLSIALDISERKRLESEMLRLDRLNLVGEMAAAIGHEIRNPLTTVRGYLQMLQRKKNNECYQEQFATMIEELDRANIIITEFLSLAKNKTVELQSNNLNSVMSPLFPLLEAEALHKGHNLKVDMTEVPCFAMDAKEIRQLLLNLARNAFEAMDTAGTLFVKTYSEDGCAVLSVRDTGPGIPQQVLNNLGTPFLTTKESGTGLGLPVCYRVADRHGAKITVDSSGAGTTFLVKFKADQL